MAMYYKAHSRVINNGTVDDAAASSLTQKQRKTNNNNGHHTHHTHHNGTQHHHREQLLTGWERVLLQNDRMAMTMTKRQGDKGRQEERKTKKGPRDVVVDVPWAVGKFFFFFLISVFLLTNLF